MITIGRWHLELRRVLPPIIFGAVAVVYMIIASGFEDTSAEAPLLYGEVMLGLSILVLIKAVIAPKAEEQAFGNTAAEETKLKEGVLLHKKERFDWGKSAAILGIILVFVGATFAVGFYIAIPIFLFLFLKFISKVSWLTAAICAVVSFAFVWFVFSWFLHLEVYPGWYPVITNL